MRGLACKAAGLAALEAYLWNCSEPFHEISLADNEITVEERKEGKLRPWWTHCCGGRWLARDFGDLKDFANLRQEVNLMRISSPAATVKAASTSMNRITGSGGNKISDLSRIQKDIQKKAPVQGHQWKGAGQPFSSVFIPILGMMKRCAILAETEADAEPWQRRKKRREAETPQVQFLGG
eukprot:Skav208886  [mRNA]  locus=scaffold270:326662:331712:- [translate_table: standard]